MKNERFPAACRLLFLAFVATVALAGCSASHVGETWQCPMTQGAQCTSVIGADPAVPHGDRPGILPVWPEAERGEPVEEVRRACTGLCRPFAWFSRLIAGGDNTRDAISEVGTAPSANLPGAPTADAGFEPVADVRVPEKIGRVWIAPWVDGGGVYREGAWVRIVIRPAEWRLP